MDDFKALPVTVLLVGCGVRGHNYTTYALAHPDRLKVVGIAEPREFQRNQMMTMHNVPDDRITKDWESLVEMDKFADGVIIATHNKLHQAPAVAFARKGYHVMLEAPIALTEEGCEEIYRACVENDVLLCSCLVLRYSPPASKIKELIDAGAVGDVVNIQHIEMYGTVYSTHSVVRGHHRRQENIGSFILAKSIHDLDLINYFMGDRKCLRISAFGHLSHFTKENKPTGSSSRCWDCSVEGTCPYSAIKTYIEPVKAGFKGFPVDNVADVIDVEHVTRAIQSGPFGRCVYDMDNNVENQAVINLQYEGGATATHTVVAFSEANGTRETRIFGTMGEIRCLFGGPVEHYDFRTRKRTIHTPAEPDDDVPEPLKHYWCSDYNTIHGFVSALRKKDPSFIKTGAGASLASHKMTFLADRAMKENILINV